MNRRTVKKEQVSVSFDPHVIAYLNSLKQQDPVMRRLSRSSIVSLLIEEAAQQRLGTSIIPEHQHPSP